MMQINQRADANAQVTTSVTLPIDKRVKSRIRVTLDDGRDAGIVLNRGEHLQDGDKLLAENGEAIVVIAASEKVSMVPCHSAKMFARACYHLGNRHVPVQIVSAADNDELIDGVVGLVSYLHDHVLDDMLRGIGLTVEVAQAPFDPEPGAYGGGHSHGDDDHAHSHTHSHTQSHSHGHSHSS